MKRSPAESAWMPLSPDRALALLAAPFFRGRAYRLEEREHVVDGKRCVEMRAVRV